MNRQGRQAAKIEPTDEIDRCAHAVIGAAIEVHRQLGPGFLESVYEEAMAVELGLRSLAYRRQMPVAVEYKGHRVAEARVDLVVRDSLVVELKAVTTLLPLHLAQALSYLKALRQPLALVINFNVPVLRDGVRRVVLSKPLSWRLGDLGG